MLGCDATLGLRSSLLRIQLQLPVGQFGKIRHC
jgi:hypothetical protein